MPLRRALVGFVGVGCLFLFVEVLMEHREVVGEYKIAWAPIIVCGLSLLTSLWAFAQWKPLSQKALQFISLLLLLVGVMGLYFHNAQRLGLEREAESHESIEHKEHEGEEHHSPPLAPLAISGMGVLGLMATYPKWKQEEQKGE